eukprot:CAMPEP_0174235740 /NCGR_PEP_ID=MMETSP0417-20130205/5093_1 /TAXON_ID=242541 /ORGANISM="Mayorella sp, Strain BSH-02190019" /LENGTH=754 /DNA_ID=CAMNT_0015314289 /DNA_START=667 /DNA_END=2931 /DNA_ORIENTATION=+
MDVAETRKHAVSQQRGQRPKSHQRGATKNGSKSSRGSKQQRHQQQQFQPRSRWGSCSVPSEHPMLQPTDKHESASQKRNTPDFEDPETSFAVPSTEYLDDDDDPAMLAALLLSLEESTNTTESKSNSGAAAAAAVTSREGNSGAGGRGGGRRRQQISLNHLLSFRVADRPAEPTYQSSTHAASRTRPLPVFRKEKFVDANFHFVLRAPSSAGACSTLHRSLLLDADCTPEWESVVAVHSSVHQTYHCPICMDQVIAPRVTKCGHIYCLCCLLRYAAVSEKRWFKCPMCFDIVLLQDLRPAFLSSNLPIQVGTKLDFVLVARPRTATFAVPTGQRVLATSLMPDDSEVAPFLRYTVESSTTAKLQEQERAALRAALEEARSSRDPSLPFMEQACVQVSDAAEMVSLHHSTQALCSCDTSSAPLNPAASASVPPGEVVSSPTSSCPLSVSASSSSFSSFSSSSSSSPVGVTGQSCVPVEEVIAGESADSFFFYRERNGRPIYLDPRSVKMLLHEYGSYRQLPRELSSDAVLELREHRQDAQLRRRYSYLAHLPLACSFSFATIDLSSVVSEKTALVFKNEVRRTRKLQHQLEASRRKQAERDLASAAAEEAERQCKIASCEADEHSEKTTPVERSSISLETGSQATISQKGAAAATANLHLPWGPSIASLDDFPDPATALAMPRAEKGRRRRFEDPGRRVVWGKPQASAVSVWNSTPRVTAASPSNRDVAESGKPSSTSSPSRQALLFTNSSRRRC